MSEPKALERLGLLGKLGIQVAGRRKTGIGILLGRVLGFNAGVVVALFGWRPDPRGPRTGTCSRCPGRIFFRSRGINLGTHEGARIVFGDVSQLNQGANSFRPENWIVLHSVVYGLIRDRLFVDQAAFGPQPLHQQKLQLFHHLGTVLQKVADGNVRRIRIVSRHVRSALAGRSLSAHYAGRILLILLLILLLVLLLVLLLILLVLLIRLARGILLAWRVLLTLRTLLVRRVRLILWVLGALVRALTLRCGCCKAAPQNRGNHRMFLKTKFAH